MKGCLFVLLLMVAGQSYAADCEVNSGTSYSGECKDGLADGYGTGLGVKIYRQDGSYKGRDTYVGYYSKGNREGKGVFTWLDGDRYEGNWKNDQREGFNRYYSSSGTLKKEGLYIGGSLVKECSKEECDPEYLYKDFDTDTKVDIVMSKIINTIKNDKNAEALIYINYLQTLNVKLPEAFYPQYIQVLNANKLNIRVKDVAKEYIQKYGKTGKFYGEMIEALSR